MRNYDILFRLLIAGDSGTGKSCLMTQFADRHIDDDHKLTIGVDFRLKSFEIENKIIKAQIYDTVKSIQPGHKRFRNILDICTGASCILLVFSLANYESFANLDEWTKLLKVSKDDLIIIVGNKSDLHKERKVPMDEAINYAIGKGYYYIECSSKDFYLTQEIFHTAIEALFQIR